MENEQAPEKNTNIITKTLHAILRIIMFPIILPFKIIFTIITLPNTIYTILTKSDENDFKSESIEAALQNSSSITVLVSVIGCLLVFIAITWAYFAKLDEITRGSGTVIPSSRLQVVENMEGGVIKEIYIRDGDRVESGKPLLLLDDVHFAAKYRENEVEYYSEYAKVLRLKAEIHQESSINFPSELTRKYIEYVSREREIFKSRIKTLKQTLEIADQDITKSIQELRTIKSKLTHMKNNYNLMKKEYDWTLPMAEEGVVSKVQLLRLEQKLGDVKSQVDETNLAVPRLQAALQQNQGKLKNITLQFKEKSIEELNKAEVRLEQLTVNKNSLKDRVSRTVVRSPVDGIVKKIHINTIGGVVDPGMDLVDIIPLDDSLLIEVKVPSKDIAFLRTGLSAVVRFGAFDFTIYGGLKGTVVRISPDAVEDKQTGAYFYLTQIKTDRSYFGSTQKQMPIIPGMQAQVDILTGKKTVLDYLLKPIMKAKKVALTER